jgi:hypothetical protein
MEVRWRLPALGYHIAKIAVITILFCVILGGSISCQSGGNATTQQRTVLLAAVRNYWNTGRDYSLGFKSAAGDLVSANVQGNEAEVVVEIILGYTEPTDGASYKDVTFRLNNENGVWKVTYDGWIDKQLS